MLLECQKRFRLAPWTLLIMTNYNLSVVLSHDFVHFPPKRWNETKVHATIYAPNVQLVLQTKQNGF